MKPLLCVLLAAFCLRAGSLSCTVSTVATTQNITTLASGGTGSDWFAYYNQATGSSATPANTKNISPHQFGGYAITSPSWYSNDPRGLTYTDGHSGDDGGAAQTAETNGMFTLSLLATAIQFTVTADTQSRTAYFFLSGFNTTGKVTIHLSDSSAPDYTDSQTSTGQYDAAYTCTYTANSASQTLSVTYANTGSGGTVNVNAGAVTSPSSPAGTKGIPQVL